MACMESMAADTKSSNSYAALRVRWADCAESFQGCSAIGYCECP